MFDFTKFPNLTENKNQNKSDNFPLSTEEFFSFQFHRNPAPLLTSSSFLFREKVREEQTKFDDILQVDMIDHYNNLTLKSVFTLKFFLNESNFDDPPPFHLMKIDNDAYLNLPQLVKILKDPKLKKTDMYLVGHR